jgi:hypothetical protein
VQITFLCQLFHKQVFRGNSDQQSIVTNAFSPAITARYIRIQPITWYGYISMRFEIYGCYRGKRFNIMYCYNYSYIVLFSVLVLCTQVNMMFVMLL